MYRFTTRDDHKNWQHLECRLIWILSWIFHLPFPTELQELIKSLDSCVVAQNQTKVGSSRNSTYKALNQSTKGESHWYIHAILCLDLPGL